MEVSWAQRCRTTQTHERNPLPSFIATDHHKRIPHLPSFIATGRHERIPTSRHSSQRATTSAFPPPVIHRNGPPRTHSPSCHSRVGGNLDARSTNHSTNASSDLAGARVFP